MTISRRTFFRGAVLLASVAGLSACSNNTPQGYDGEPRALPIPPLLEGEMKDGVREFNLDMRTGHSEILPGNPDTRTWGFNGDFLGPTLRVNDGEQVRMHVRNDLPEMTTVHWHGMKLPALADGGPHSPIDPGETWSPSWTVDQPQATCWYHPHPHGVTGLHCYRGLAGVFIVADDNDAELPCEYGVDDIPVVITDAKFTDDGQLDNRVDPTLGLLGNTPLVNGITNARWEGDTGLVRLRVVNSANMRFWNLALSNEAPLQVVATDSGLLDEPVTVDTVLLSPGERVELLVELPADDDVILQSVPVEGNFGLPEDDEVDFGFQDSYDLLQLRGNGAGGTVPATLVDADVPSAEGLKEREFVLNTFMINGEYMDMARVDEVIDSRDPEIWTVTNENSDWPHNFHIHDARFRVLEFDGGEVPTVGWKDTVALPPKSKAKLLVEFGYHPDPTVSYMFHCHMLLHEDEGMMGQFVVVEPGEKPDVRVNARALVHEKHGGHAAHAAQSIDTSRSPQRDAVLG